MRIWSVSQMADRRSARGLCRQKRMPQGVRRRLIVMAIRRLRFAKLTCQLADITIGESRCNALAEGLMIRTQFVAMGLALGLLCYSSSTRAVTINFDTDAVGNPLTAPIAFVATSPLSRQYASLTFSGPGAGQVVQRAGTKRIKHLACNPGEYEASPRRFISWY
jgi:hypothetical protein